MWENKNLYMRSLKKAKLHTSQHINIIDLKKYTYQEIFPNRNQF